MPSRSKRAAISVEPRDSRFPAVLGAIAAATLAFIVFGNALANPFMLDDRIVIAGDARVRDADWDALLTHEYWPGPRGNGLYRPLASLSFALNWLVSPSPVEFRAVNILMHAAVSWLVALLSWRWFGDRRIAFGAGLLFLLHPIHSSCINQVVDRAEIGAALFGLIALLLAAPGRNGRSAEGPRFGRFLVLMVIAPLCFAAAIGFKESVVTVLPIAVLAQVALRGRAGSAPTSSIARQALWESTPLRFAPWVIVLAFVLMARGLVIGGLARDPAGVALIDNPLAALDELGLTPGERVFARWATPVAVFARGLAKLLWPHPLFWDYSFASVGVVRSFVDGWLWAGVVAVVAIVSLFLNSWRRTRVLALSLGFLVIAGGVTSNALFPIGTLFAERFLYLPSAGFCMAVAACVVALWNRLCTRGSDGGPVRLASACIVFGVLGMMAYANIARAADWRSTERLNARDLATNPKSARLWCSVSVDRLNAGDFGEAIAHAEKAMAICPSYSTAWRIAGLADARLGRAPRAIERLRRAIDLGDFDNEQGIVTLATLLKDSGDYAAAIAELSALVHIRSDAATAQNNLAWYLITAEPTELRDLQLALIHAREAVRLAPKRGDALDTLASVLEALGRPDLARDEVRTRLPHVAADDPFREDLLRRIEANP